MHEFCKLQKSWETNFTSFLLILQKKVICRLDIESLTKDEAKRQVNMFWKRICFRISGSGSPSTCRSQISTTSLSYIGISSYVKARGKSRKSQHYLDFYLFKTRLKTCLYLLKMLLSNFSTLSCHRIFQLFLKVTGSIKHKKLVKSFYR